MRWLARLALVAAALALGALPGPQGLGISSSAIAAPNGNDRSGASQGKSDRGGKSEKSGRGGGKRSGGSGRGGSSSDAGETGGSDPAPSEPAQPDAPGVDSSVPVRVDSPTPAPSEAEPSAEPPGGSGEPDPNESGEDSSGEENAEPGDPGASDPGSSDPGSSDPGSSDPGASDPGASEPGASDPGPGDLDPVAGQPQPSVPVKVDAPAPAPSEPGPEPETPVRVDAPAPAPGPSEPSYAPEPSAPVEGPSPDPDAGATPGDVAETPETAAPEESAGLTPARPAEAGAGAPGPGAEDDKPGLRALIDGVLRRGRLQEAARDGAARAPAPVTAPPAVIAAPIEPEAVAPAAPKAKTVVTATAPRIALSSGSGGATYRQYEISALGLTPRSRQVIGALGFRILSERRSPLLGNRIVARLRTPNNQTAEAAIARVRQALPELTVDFAHLYRPSGDATAPVRYGAEMIGAPAEGACRIETRIGLIDSGVGSHPTLARAKITRRNFVEGDAATNVAHGTAIASILVGDLPGAGPLAPGAEVLSANVFAQDAGGLRADAHAIIAALDWMAAQRAPVVNLSLMGPSNALLEQAVAAAAGRGQVLVAAAGNDGPDAAPAYPAAYPGVIAVAAVDARGRPYGRNNRGGYVYVSAPGVDVWGADARGGQAFWTGTSFAAPFVTATLARDVALGRARDINDGRARIAASARDLGAPGRDPIYGYGLLQTGGCSGTGPPVLSAKD